MEGGDIVAMGLDLGRGYPGSNQTMPKTTSTAILLLLTLVLGDAMSSFAKTDNMSFLSMPQRSLSNSKNNSRSFTFGLMHAHHKDLAYIEPNLSLSKRTELLVRSGEKRFNYLANQISGKQMNFGKEHLYYEVEALVKHAAVFLVELEVGTPPSVVTLEMDTSSDFTWLHCDPCTECRIPQHGGFDGHQTIIYNPQPSRSYKALSCHSNNCQNLIKFRNKCPRQEGDIFQICQYSYPSVVWRNWSELNGDISMEKFTLFDGHENIIRELVFGCGRRNKGQFRLNTGVLGLAGRSLSTLSILWQLEISVFWYCLVGYQFFTTEKSPLVFGEGGMQDIDMDTFQTFDIIIPRRKDLKPFYYVKLKFLYVNWIQLPLHQNVFSMDVESRGGTIMDSGIPFSYLNSNAFGVLKEAVEASLRTYERMIPKPGVNTPFKICYNIKDADIDILPNITLGFQHGDRRVKMHLPTQNAFIVQKHGLRTIACLAFKENLPTQDNNMLNAIGAFQQQNFIMVFGPNNIMFQKADHGCQNVHPNNQGR